MEEPVGSVGNSWHYIEPIPPQDKRGDGVGLRRRSAFGDIDSQVIVLLIANESALERACHTTLRLLPAVPYSSSGNTKGLARRGRPDFLHSGRSDSKASKHSPV